MKLHHKVALVTGASSGIGQAIALSLAAQGARVTVVARREEPLRRLVEGMAGRGEQGLALVADLTDPAQAQEVVERSRAHWGGLDILINNAGLMLVGPIAGADPAEWRRMFDLNVLALMVLSQAALPHLKARGGGHIVNLSSVSGRQVSLGSAAYCASKFAVTAFSEGLRKEVHQDNISVVTVEPGLVATELYDQIPDPAVRQAVRERYLSTQQLLPEDVAAAVTYAVTQPPRVSVNEILLRPITQP